MKKIIKWFNDKSILLCLILAVLINLIIEILNRKSIFLGIRHFVLSPHIFVYNSFYIVFTLFFSFLFKRKNFALLCISVCWIILGITNGVVLSYRVTPLSAIDFKILKSAVTMSTIYFGFIEYALIIILFLGVVGLIIFAFIKTSKEAREYKKTIIAILLVGVILSGMTTLYQITGVLSNSYKNLNDGYSKYGFIYCFLSTIVNVGIDEPKDYSVESVNIIKNEIDLGNSYNSDMYKNILEDKFNFIVKKEEKYNNKDLPNIIFLQLESFFDINYLQGVKFSQDPIPTFRNLKKKYSSGFLTVPMVGSGTANTEFEILSGMSLDFFGPGEFPYTTILRESTAETICYNLKELGYKTTAIHNNTGTFYGRNEVFSRLGFDTFIPIEAMRDIKYTPTGWAKDEVLIDEIINSIKSTTAKDFVHAISVEGHGKYTIEKDDYKIKVEGAREEITPQLEYYAELINSMDIFLRDLIEELKKVNEKIILVVYGDHFPAIDIFAEELENNNLFQTEYVVWNNCNLPVEDKNLHTYQLSANILEQINLVNGTLTKFHISNCDEDDYMSEMELLEYDMLYGDKVVYGGKNPFEQVDMKIGLKYLQIDRIYFGINSIVVEGRNFTNWTRVLINGKKRNTTVINSNMLSIDFVKLRPGDVISLALVANDGTILDTYDEFVVKENINRN